MPKIKEMYAFVAVDKDSEDEGVVGAQTHYGMMPLVSADMDRVEALRRVAKQAATVSGKVIRLLKFSVREELEVIEP